MNSPYKHYQGGKGSSGTYQTIINEIPPHKRLIIPFAGNCAITRNIKPAEITFLIDKHDQVCDRWEKYLTCGSFKPSQKVRYHIINSDGIKYLKNNIETFSMADVVYCDPPYLISTRSSSTTKYDCDLTESDHSSLLMVLLQLKCPVLISTYPNRLYKTMLSNWRVKKYYSLTRKGRRLELLYMNFGNPLEVLHDYAHAGKNFRERERIKKKVNRYELKFQTMNTLDRNCVFDRLSGSITNGGGVQSPIPLILEAFIKPGDVSSSRGPNIKSGDVIKGSRDPLTKSGVNGSKQKRSNFKKE